MATTAPVRRSMALYTRPAAPFPISSPRRYGPRRRATRRPRRLHRAARARPRKPRRAARAPRAPTGLPVSRRAERARERMHPRGVATSQRERRRLGSDAWRRRATTKTAAADAPAHPGCKNKDFDEIGCKVSAGGNVRRAAAAPPLPGSLPVASSLTRAPPLPLLFRSRSARSPPRRRRRRRRARRARPRAPLTSCSVISFHQLAPPRRPPDPSLDPGGPSSPASAGDDTHRRAVGQQLAGTRRRGRRPVRARRRSRSLRLVFFPSPP